MYRILIAQFKHETNTFNAKKTTLDDYRRRNLTEGEALMTRNRGSESELGAFIEVFEKRGDVEIIPTIDADAIPAGTVTKETYDYIAGKILESYKREADRAARGECAPIDGICLALHGAQVNEYSEDGEGYLLKALRKLTGPELPIVMTLDFHANLTKDMVEMTTALFPARYYPHTDFYDRGKDAAHMMLDVLDGKAHPTAAFKQLRMIYPHIPTADEPVAGMIDSMIREADADDVHFVGFDAGFSRSDISIQGSCIYALTENDPAKAEALCEKYYRFVLDHLESFEIKITDPDEAAEEAMQHPGLSLIADAADNPGSGLYGDATEILHVLMRHGAKKVAVATIWDPETAEAAWAAGPGKTIHVRLGGKSSDKVGAPIETDAYVKAITDGNYVIKGPMKKGVQVPTGKTAVLTFGEFTVVVISNKTQSFDMESLRANGVEPLDFEICVVKSAVHYRAAWKQVSDHLLTVDMPNITSFDEKKIDYRHVKRPIFPLDSADSIRAYDL